MPFSRHRIDNRARGFTLIELLISLSIFAILTTMTITNYNAGTQSDELRSAGQLLASAVRRAQTMALSGQTENICLAGSDINQICTPGAAATCPPGQCVAEVPHGYGIHVSTISSENTQYVIFADINGNRAYDQGEAIRTDTVSSGRSVIVSAVNPAASGSLDIVFEPPQPKAWFNGSNAAVVADITLKHTATNATRNVTVNLITGQVNAD
jgi:prepilin-type N-terminal cleavage/methylation domain-containing protein